MKSATEQQLENNAANRRIYSKRHREKVKHELVTLKKERDSYKEEIDSYKEEIDSYKEEIDSLKAANETLLNVVGTLESKCENLLERASLAESSIDTLLEHLHGQPRSLQQDGLDVSETVSPTITRSPVPPVSPVSIIYGDQFDKDQVGFYMTDQELELLDISS
jgi:chromosome segregation ATPase